LPVQSAFLIGKHQIQFVQTPIDFSSVRRTLLRD
jgi:hypothetical protein